MADQFIFKTTTFATTDYGDIQTQSFKDPSFGYTPQDFMKIGDIAGESQRLTFSDDGLVPGGLDDILG
ncbi:hypothetical protein [Primorskyibacter sp. 2E233]|uniref:hypothetical protein n=1 Tax=Primorskyibacter sp. 2E233 TaxID=3413431 RepID=UPI003BF2D58F